MTDFDIFKTEPASAMAYRTLAMPALRPQTIDEVDVRQAVLEDIALKTLYLSGSLSILELAERTRLSFEVAKELAFRLRTELLCRSTG